MISITHSKRDSSISDNVCIIGNRLWCSSRHSCSPFLKRVLSADMNEIKPYYQEHCQNIRTNRGDYIHVGLLQPCAQCTVHAVLASLYANVPSPYAIVASTHTNIASLPPVVPSPHTVVAAPHGDVAQSVGPFISKIVLIFFYIIIHFSLRNPFWKERVRPMKSAWFCFCFL